MGGGLASTKAGRLDGEGDGEHGGGGTLERWKAAMPKSAACVESQQRPRVASPSAGCGGGKLGGRPQ